MDIGMSTESHRTKQLCRPPLLREGIIRIYMRPLPGQRDEPLQPFSTKEITCRLCRCFICNDRPLSLWRQCAIAHLNHVVWLELR